MNTPFILNPVKHGIKTNKDIIGVGLLSLYKVHRAGSTHGEGLFARRAIFKNEEIIRATGPIINASTAETLYWSYGIDIVIKISLSKYILPNNESRFINHSCEPNTGFKEAGVFVAMKDIEPTDELTFDYSMCDIDEDWELSCKCGLSTCRKKISGRDMFNKKLKLKEKYKGYIPQFVLKEIAKQNLL